MSDTINFLLQPETTSTNEETSRNDTENLLSSPELSKLIEDKTGSDTEPFLVLPITTRKKQAAIRTLS